MMDREWDAILTRHGQSLVLHQGGAEPIRLKAFLQPVLDREREQQFPTPLGFQPEERYLYLGPIQAPLKAGESRIIWKDRSFEVQAAHPVADSHWWAILRPADQEVL